MFLFLFYVSCPTGSISAIVAFHNLGTIITGKYKDNILTSNINLNTSVVIYIQYITVSTSQVCIGQCRSRYTINLIIEEEYRRNKIDVNK